MRLSGYALGSKAMVWRWLLHGDGYQAARHNTIQVCLKHGATLNYNAIEDSSPLLTAAYAGVNQVYVLEALLFGGADPNVQGSGGVTALGSLRNEAYSPEDKSRVIKVLISHGARVNLANASGSTPLHLHAKINLTATLRILLDHRASVEAKCDRKRTVYYSRSALDTASYFGNVSCVRALLSRGRAVLTPRKAGITLGYAICMDRLEVVRVLLREYPGIFADTEVLQAFNTAYSSPLSHAVSHESMSVLNEVLQVKPELDFRDVSEPTLPTALESAISYGQVESAILLVELGATPFCRGDPAEENTSFIREFIFGCAFECKSLKPRLSELIHRTKSCVDRHNLMKSID